MTAQILFAGSRLDSVTATYGVPEETTSGIQSISDAGINVRNGGVQIKFSAHANAPLIVGYSIEAGSTLYFHTYLTTSGPADYVTFYDASGYPWLIKQGNGQLVYNSGTGAVPVWTNVGNDYGSFPGGFLDIILAIGSSGTHTVTMAYNNTAVVGPVTFTQASLTNLASIQLTSQNDGYQDVVFSQILCTENISTVGALVPTSRPNGAGADTGWSGAYTNVNEPITDDTTFDQSATAGQAQSYTMSGITVPEGYSIGGVFAYIRVKNDGNAPENVDALIRSASHADYLTGLATPGVTFAGQGVRYDTNPLTSAAWQPADWNAPIQLGYKSA